MYSGHTVYHLSTHTGVAVQKQITFIKIKSVMFNVLTYFSLHCMNVVVIAIMLFNLLIISIIQLRLGLVLIISSLLLSPFPFSYVILNNVYYEATKFYEIFCLALNITNKTIITNNYFQNF